MRRELNKMDSAAPGGCPEADGLVVDDAAGAFDDAIRKATFIPLAVKAYPQSLAELLQFAARKYPEHDWEARSLYDWPRVHRAMTCCAEAIDAACQPPKKGVRKVGVTNTTDFALVAAARMETWAYIDETAAHVFDPIVRRWKTGGLKTIEQHITSTLEHIFSRKFYREQHGRIHAKEGDVPGPLKTHTWLTGVRLEVRTLLQARPPQFDTIRHILPFDNGFVFDFAKQQFMPAQPRMKTTRYVPFPYEPCKWPAEIRSAYLTAIDDVVEHVKTLKQKEQLLVIGGGGLDVVTNPDPGAVVGLPTVKAAIEAAIAVSPALQFLSAICTKDVDDIAYLCQHFARAFSSFGRLCEALFFYGTSGCGKDALTQLLDTCLGDLALTGYGGGVPNTYFVKTPNAPKRDKESCTPFLAALAGARLCVVPEIPKGELDMDSIKPLTEQQGAKVSARKAHGNSVRENPGFLIIGFSNYSFNIGFDPDGGKLRRFNVYRMRAKFGDDDGGDETRPEADATIKEKIIAHELSMDFFHVVSPWYRVLECYITNIRRSIHVQEDTELCLQGSEEDTQGQNVKTLAEKLFKPAESLVDTLSATDVKTHMGDALGGGIKKADLVVLLQENGFSFSDKLIARGRRYCKYRFVAGEANVALKTV